MFASEVRLSDRQLDILLNLIEGRTSAEIASRLYLSRGTVQIYRCQLLEALGARNAAQAVHRAHELGILRS